MIRLIKNTRPRQAAWTCCFLVVLIWHIPAFGSEDAKVHSHDHAGMHDAAGTHDPVPDEAAMSDADNPDTGHDHAEMVMAAEAQDADLANKVRVDEKLGAYIDLGAQFVDDTGSTVVLETIFDKPVVILPIWFLCPTVCSFLQADLAKALNKVGQAPGKDFNVITLSFSDDEGPSHASAAKKNYANLIQREFPLENWYYLTGDAENIRRVTDSLGYYFIKKKAHFYIHPNVMVVLAEDGKIIRYLYGPGFLPFDLGMAVTEAQKGEPGISIKRGVLSFCFDYDPENKTYVFKMFRITGTAILVLLAGFVVFLLRPSKKRGKGRK